MLARYMVTTRQVCWLRLAQMLLRLSTPLLHLLITCLISSTGGSEQEIRRHIGLTRNCVALLDRHIYDLKSQFKPRSVST